MALLASRASAYSTIRSKEFLSLVGFACEEPYGWPSCRCVLCDPALVPVELLDVPGRDHYKVLSTKRRSSSTENSHLSKYLILYSTSTMLPDIAAYVPKAAIKAFAAIGFVIVVKFVLDYVKLLLDLFVLSGTNVSFLPWCLLFTFAYADNSYANMARKALGPLSPVLQMALAKSLPFNSPRKASISYSSLEPNPNSTR